MKRILLALCLALAVSAGGVGLWQLSTEMSHREIDAHLRAEAGSLRNKVLAELRSQELKTERPVALLRAQHSAWLAAHAPYPSPFPPDEEAEDKWRSQRLTSTALTSGLPRKAAAGFAGDHSQSTTFASGAGDVFELRAQGYGLYKAEGGGRIWLATPAASVAPAPYLEPPRKAWVAIEMDDEWFKNLALETGATVVVMGNEGVVRTHGPADAVAVIIDRMADKNALPVLTDTTDGLAAAKVKLHGSLAIVATTGATNAIRFIERRYNFMNIIMLGGVAACFLVLLAWLALTGRSRRYPPRVDAPSRVTQDQDQAVSLELAHTTEMGPPGSAARASSPMGAAPSRLSGRMAPGGGRLGRYTLVAPLGEGGMAEIFSAISFGSEGFRRAFVLKRLKPHLASHEGVVEQFIDEAKLAASLQHTNILSVLDFGCEAEEYFMATDYVLGRNLGQIIEKCQGLGHRAVTKEMALYFTHELLQGLAYAHGQVDAKGHNKQIVHRDVSVNNVMLSNEGNVKLLDFGIAKAFERSSNTTQQGVIKGNILYMSPEQAQGLHVDQRSDIFSAGLVLLSLLTGQAPYRGTSQYKVLLEAARGPQEVGTMLQGVVEPALITVITRALEADPDKRQQTAAEFAEELRHFPMADRIAASAFLNDLFGEQLEAEKRNLESTMRSTPEPEHGADETGRLSVG